MVKEIESDIFLADTDVIIHQANCFCTMGSGIARFIREKFPEVYEADCMTEKGSLDKLGSYSCARVVSENPNPRLKYIVNLYSQFNFGRDEKHTNYEAMYQGLVKLRDKIVNNPQSTVKTLAIPHRIGSNLGGADWNVVKAIIYSVFENCPLTVLICKNPALQDELLNKASR